MDGSKYEQRVKTLWGVIHEAMEAGKDFEELRREVKEWLFQYDGTYNVCTVVEERENGYQVIARYHSAYEDIAEGLPYHFCDVPVPESYLEQARARFLEQRW